MDAKSIIYILDYNFKNGQKLKNRFFIILDKDKSSSIILSVITSQNHIPDSLLKHGCIVQEESNIHCYSFSKEKIVGNSGFKFPKDSFIYINATSVFKAEIANLLREYPSIETKDSVTDSEYGELLYCIYKSKYLPRQIKRKLEEILSDIYK